MCISYVPPGLKKFKPIRGESMKGKMRTKFYKKPKNSKTTRKKTQLMLEDFFGVNYSSNDEK